MVAVECKLHEMLFSLGLKVFRCLSSGCGCNNSATVSLAWHRPTEQHVAVKRINLEKCEMDFSIIQVSCWWHRCTCLCQNHVAYMFTHMRACARACTHTHTHTHTHAHTYCIMPTSQQDVRVCMCVHVCIHACVGNN